MAGTDTEWEKWGREDPYFGVVSFAKFSRGRIADSRAEFFEMGKKFVADTLSRFERNFGPLRRGNALDFGCGVGRLTLALAREFESVTGLDISPSMLDEAGRNAREFGVSNVGFALSDDSLSEARGQFDFVNSYIVLQHIPTHRGMPIIERLIDKVRPGGGFLIHVSVRTDGVLPRTLYWMRHNVPGLGALQNLRMGRPLSAPAMQMNAYPLQAILAQLVVKKAPDLYLFGEMHGSAMTFGMIGKKALDGVELAGDIPVAV